MRASAVLAFVSLVALAGAALAEPVYQGNGFQVRLYQRPCSSEELASVVKTRADKSATVKAALVVVMGGRHVAACWALDPLGRVTLVDAEGDAGFLSWEAFTDDPGV